VCDQETSKIEEAMARVGPQRHRKKKTNKQNHWTKRPCALKMADRLETVSDRVACTSVLLIDRSVDLLILWSSD